MDQPIFSKWSWLALISILLVMATLAGFLLYQEFNEDLAIERKSAEQQFQARASIISSEMNSGRYEYVNSLFNKWAETNDDILELRLYAANGFNLASYKRPAGGNHTLELKFPISYSYHGEAEFSVRMNLDKIYQRHKKVGVQTAALFAVFAMILAFLLHMAIRLQKEARKSRHLSNLYKALSEVNQAIVRMDQQADIFPLVCRCAVDFGDMSMAFVAQVDEKSNLFFQAASYGSGLDYLEGIVISPLADVPEGRGPIGIAYRENHAVIVNDYFNEPVTAPWRKRVSKKEWQSAAAFPIPRGGRPFAVLSVYHRQLNAFDAEAIALLDEMSRDISFALDNFDREKQRLDAEESLQLAASVYAASNEGILISDANNRIISINPAFTNITGYSPEDVIGKNPSIQSSGRHDKAFYLAMWQSINTTGKWSGEIWDKRKNGEIYPAWLTISTVAGKEGKVTRYIASHLDITELKYHESQVAESEQRLLDILNVSPIAVRIAIRQGRKVVFYNPRYADLLKNIDPVGVDPQKYYVRVEEYEKVLAELDRGESIINRQIELNIPGSPTVWTLASYMPIQYKGEQAALGWFYDITSLKAAEEKIRDLAFHDSLTRLPNRQLLLDRLQQALASSARSGHHGALLFIDLDNFKILNDTLGHHIGDLLLQQVAGRLKSCVREGDTVARIGGDEFVVMLEDLSEQAIDAAAQIEAFGDKILGNLNQPYQLAAHAYRSTPSIGATLYKGHEQDRDELLKQADIAMYQAKKAGRNTLRFFDFEMQNTINARVALEGELSKALELKQFHLHYQIQIDSLYHPIGAEALIRWMHPKLGLVSPDQFIPLAEETGLILPIGKWVLETACAVIKAWQQNELTRDLVLAVNVSAKQFHQPDFVSHINETLRQHGIKASLLKLEITESMLFEDIDAIIAIMNALKQVGVQFSLDDFGTGYSSLQYLKSLPLDQIKIDQSFVRDLGTDSNDEALVRAIIAMAHSLNLEVIAEGVETEHQREFLLRNGCTQYQGYLFSKPLALEKFEALLKQG
jgi:diguanylate cyclase (GGDEF)-like protein/PAS domain S-box-containing protein